MAIKLTQGADSTIVTAATRAGLATSPKDYSKTFESVASSYDKSMQASAEAWGQIAGSVAMVGAELIKNGDAYSDPTQRVFDAGGSEELMNNMYDIKDELKELGSLGGMFGDRETRKKRAEILSRRNKLFSEIDGWATSLEEASLAAKNGLLDENLMGPNGIDSDFVNAIIASNTNNKITSEGNEAKVSRDATTGEIMYTLYKSDGTAVEPPKTMSLSSFKTLIQDSAKDVDNVIGKALTGITDGAENYGATYGGAMGEYNKGKLLTSLDPLTNNAAKLKRGMRTKFGHSGTSFYDEITSGDGSKYFSLMLQDKANVTEKGEINLNALGDVKDTDGSGGISQEEINTQYVLFSASILSGEGPLAKKLFTDFVIERAEEAYNFGAKQKAKGTPVEEGGPSQFFLGRQYIPAAAVTPDVNILNEDPNDIPARTAWNDTIFRKVNGQYQQYENGDFVDVTKEQLRVALEFSEKVGYDMSGARTSTVTPTTPEVPADFDKAFRKNPGPVVQYFKNNPNLYPGMKVEKTTKDDPEDGNDTFRVTMPDGTSKVFTADPFIGDKRKIKAAWDWINSNYVNNEFAE